MPTPLPTQPQHPDAPAYVRARGTTVAPVRRSTAGFTLVEMLVAMIILMLVLGIISRVLMDGMSGERATALERRAQASSVDLLDQLSSDLRAAYAPERSKVTTRDDLAVLLGTDLTAKGNGNGNGNGNGKRWRRDTTVPDYDIRDILVAAPNALWIRVDAVVEPAGTQAQTECVGYYLTTAGAVIREVRPDGATCTQAGVAVEMLPAPPPGATVPTALFEYSWLGITRAGVRRNGNGNGNAHGHGRQFRAGECAAQTPEAGPFDPTGDEINRIVIVDLNVTAWAEGVTSASEQASSSMEVRNRLTPNYLYALGCGA